MCVQLESLFLVEIGIEIKAKLISNDIVWQASSKRKSVP